MQTPKIRYVALRVPGKGWTVGKVTGSKRTGRTIEREAEFAEIDSYTMHQAQLAARNHGRAMFRFNVNKNT